MKQILSNNGEHVRDIQIGIQKTRVVVIGLGNLWKWK